MMSPLGERLTPDSGTCPDSSLPRAPHGATLEEAQLLLSCRASTQGHPEVPENWATVRAASAHPEELGTPLVLSSRVPGPTLTQANRSANEGALPLASR
jgi:hypothetical protein